MESSTSATSAAHHTSPEFALENARLRGENAALKLEIQRLANQLEWFQKQIFGKKSERRFEDVFPVWVAVLCLIALFVGSHTERK